MPSTAGCLDRWLSVLDGAGEIRTRKMMGEYLVYLDGKYVAGIFDDRFLVKITKASATMMRDAPSAIPYEGGGEMILAEYSIDPAFLKSVLRSVWEELPEPKKKK